MTAVIQFPADRRNQLPRATGHIKAEVIIFPGVRIERMDAVPAERVPLRGKRPSAQLQLREDFDEV